MGERKKWSERERREERQTERQTDRQMTRDRQSDGGEVVLRCLLLSRA